MSMVVSGIAEYLERKTGCCAGSELNLRKEFSGIVDRNSGVRIEIEEMRIAGNDILDIASDCGFEYLVVVGIVIDDFEADFRIDNAGCYWTDEG